MRCFRCNTNNAISSNTLCRDCFKWNTQDELKRRKSLKEFQVYHSWETQVREELDFEARIPYHQMRPSLNNLSMVLLILKTLNL